MNVPLKGFCIKIKNANGSWVNGDAVVITNRDPYLRIEKDDFVIVSNGSGRSKVKYFC